jgi:hypothetical protein
MMIAKIRMRSRILSGGLNADDPLKERHHSGGMNGNFGRYEKKSQQDLPQHTPCSFFYGSGLPIDDLPAGFINILRAVFNAERVKILKNFLPLDGGSCEKIAFWSPPRCKPGSRNFLRV